MKLITPRQLIRELPTALRTQWKSTFGDLNTKQFMVNSDYCNIKYKTAAQIIVEVEALDLDHATVNDLKKIGCMLPNWVNTECNECGRENVDVVRLGEEPDYESNTASICLDCLNKAFQLMTPHA